MSPHANIPSHTVDSLPDSQRKLLSCCHGYENTHTALSYDSEIKRTQRTHFWGHNTPRLGSLRAHINWQSQTLEKEAELLL